MATSGSNLANGQEIFELWTKRGAVLIRFNDIELDSELRELRRNGETVAVEPKVFDLLEYFVTQRDRVISKDDLIKAVWNGRFISDSAVSSAVKFARKAVGDDGTQQHTIKTVFGRGYRFVRDIETQANTPVPAAPDARALAQKGQVKQTNLRRRQGPLLGRDEELQRLQTLITKRQLISIVGPGGAGKSALAQEIGRHMLAQFAGGVWFAELASTTGAQVESAILGTLNDSAGAGPVNAEMISERLGITPTLLILDNCEHVIDEIATLIVDLTDLVPSLTILTTSREPIDILGEQIVRIAGLAYTSDAAPAVGLFLHRAAEVSDIQDTAETNQTIRKIVERLEGLPLAIELAVPRLASNTPTELLAALDDQLSVLASRRRHTSVRHSTMDDAISWSFELLAKNERQTLLDLSQFAGAFTTEAAVAVCRGANVADALHRLVQQSMVSYVQSDRGSRFKLLEPIRQFADRHLDEGTKELVAERHANWFAQRTVLLAKDMRGPNEIEASEALTAEWADLGRALAWGRANRRADIAIAPLVSLHIHILWQLRIEGFAWLEAAIPVCDLSKDDKAKTDLVRAMGFWSAGDLETSEALLRSSALQLGETTEVVYLRFYQAFAREDYKNVNKAGETAYILAHEDDDIAWQIITAAFRAVGRMMMNPNDPTIEGLFSDLDERLKIHRWPSGECAVLLAKTTFGFVSGNAEEGEAYRLKLDDISNACHAPWFQITASAVGAQSQSKDDDPLAKAARTIDNMRAAVASGDVMQIPAMIRFATIELAGIEELEAAAKIIGLVPKIRGLGEKGTMAPGYNDAVKKVRESLPLETYKALLQTGAALTLEDAVAEMETALARHSDTKD